MTTTSTMPGAKVSYELTEDIKPKWLNVIRRLQAAAQYGNAGLAILSIKVLVNERGEPISWTQPQRTKLEPKDSGWFDIFLANLTN